MLGPQTANLNLTLTSGTIQLYDSDLNLGDGGLSGASDSSYIVTNGTGRLIRNVGTSFVGFPVGTGVSYNPVTVKTETGLESFGVNVVEGITPSMTNASSAVQRTWRISEGTPGGNGTIAFTTQWNSGEEGSAFDRDTIEGWRNTGGPWIMQSGSLIDVTPAGYPAVRNHHIEFVEFLDRRQLLRYRKCAFHRRMEHHFQSCYKESRHRFGRTFVSGSGFQLRDIRSSRVQAINNDSPCQTVKGIGRSLQLPTQVRLRAFRDRWIQSAF